MCPTTAARKQKQRTQPHPRKMQALRVVFRSSTPGVILDYYAWRGFYAPGMLTTHILILYAPWDRACLLTFLCCLEWEAEGGLVLAVQEMGGIAVSGGEAVVGYVDCWGRGRRWAWGWGSGLGGAWCGVSGLCGRSAVVLVLDQ